MSYLPEIDKKSPFDVGKCTSANSGKIFNIFNVDWLSLDGSSNIVADESKKYYSETAYSPDSNSYGIMRVYTGDSSKHYLKGNLYPESNASGAGGYARGDDVCIYYGNSHKPQVENYLSMTDAMDIARNNMKIIKIKM